VAFVEARKPRRWIKTQIVQTKSRVLRCPERSKRSLNLLIQQRRKKRRLPEELYREVCINNVLKDENGEEVALKEGDKVDVTIEADPKDIIKETE